MQSDIEGQAERAYRLADKLDQLALKIKHRSEKVRTQGASHDRVHRDIRKEAADMNREVWGALDDLEVALLQERKLLYSSKRSSEAEVAREEKRLRAREEKKLRTRRSNRKFTIKKKRLEKVQVKSDFWVHLSDTEDNAEEDREFFAKEEKRRKKVAAKNSIAAARSSGDEMQSDSLQDSS